MFFLYSWFLMFIAMKNALTITWLYFFGDLRWSFESWPMTIWEKPTSPCSAALEYACSESRSEKRNQHVSADRKSSPNEVFTRVGNSNISFSWRQPPGQEFVWGDSVLSLTLKPAFCFFLVFKSGFLDPKGSEFIMESSGPGLSRQVVISLLHYVPEPHLVVISHWALSAGPSSSSPSPFKSH